MEYEEMVSLVEMVELTEDDEPPSSCESIDYTFAFKYVRGQVDAQPTKNLTYHNKKSPLKTDLSVLKNWRWPIKDAITSAEQQESMLRYPQQIMMLTAAPHFIGLYYTP